MYIELTTWWQFNIFPSFQLYFCLLCLFLFILSQFHISLFSFVFHLSFLPSSFLVSTQATFVLLVLVCAYTSYTYVRKYTHTNKQTHTHTHTHVCVCVCVCVRARACVCVCVCVYAWLCRSKLIGIHASVSMSLCLICPFTYRIKAPVRIHA